MTGNPPPDLADRSTETLRAARIPVALTGPAEVNVTGNQQPDQPDLPELIAHFTDTLRAAGIAVGVDRAARFADAVVAVEPTTTDQLYRCALATLVSTPDDIPVLERVFRAVFEGVTVVVAAQPPDRSSRATDLRAAAEAAARHGTRTVDLATEGSPVDRVASRRFADLDDDELATLAAAMRRLRLATPARRSRRYQRSRHGRVDLRATLRTARRTAGEPVRLIRRSQRLRPRRLVVLCDISGSMRAQARAMLQLLYCAASGPRAEVFTFATRLTRVTRVLTGRPDDALRRAGDTAPDWSSGTRIAEAVRAFLDRFGAPGMARGAVVVLVSDGWETGDPALLAKQMARLRRLAYRIVWVNPRAAEPAYRPLAAGMAAALPYCDAVVGANRLTHLSTFVTALRGDVVEGVRVARRTG